MDFKASTIQKVHIGRQTVTGQYDVGSQEYSLVINADINALLAEANITASTLAIENPNRLQYLATFVSQFARNLPFYAPVDAAQGVHFVWPLRGVLMGIFNLNQDVNQSLMNVDSVDLDVLKIRDHMGDDNGLLNQRFLNETQLSEICAELEHQRRLEGVTFEDGDGKDGLIFNAGDGFFTTTMIRDTDVRDSPYHRINLQVRHVDGVTVDPDTGYASTSATLGQPV